MTAGEGGNIDWLAEGHGESLGRQCFQRCGGGMLSNFLSSRIFPKSLVASMAQPQWMVSP